MRISSQHILGLQKAYQQKNKAEKTEDAGLHPKKDGVDISSEARLFSVAIQAVKDLPPEDEKKIEELKAQIKEDRYEISNEDVADSLWNELTHINE